MTKHLLLLISICFFVAQGCSENSITKAYSGTSTDYFPAGSVRDLAESAARGNVTAIEKLVAEGVDVNSEGARGVTPLAWAAGAQNLLGVEALLRFGANPNHGYGPGSTILKTAIAQNNYELFELLLKNGANPNWRIGEETTALDYSILYDDSRFLTLSLEHGGDPNLSTSVQNLLETSTSLQVFDKALILLKGGADPKIDRRVEESIIRNMKGGYWGYSRDPAFKECLRILRKLGLTIEISADAPTREAEGVRE